VVASLIPGSESDDTSLWAFNLGPYSTVSQPTAVPSLVTDTQSLTHIGNGPILPDTK
jgi:hypothetical protein